MNHILIAIAGVAVLGGAGTIAASVAANMPTNGHRSAHPLAMLQDGRESVCSASSSGAGRPQVIVERLTGDVARSHLARLTVDPKKSAAFQRGFESLTWRGYTPTDIVLVIRTARSDARSEARKGPHIIPAQSTGSKGPHIIPAQSTGSDEGEMTFWSWDDGYNGTWEGELYGERYSDGAWDLMEGQANIETETLWAMWANNLGHQGPGGPIEVSLPGASPVRGRFQLASFNPGSTAPGVMRVVQTTKTPRQRFHGWLQCTAGGCGWISLGCLSWGPLAPECWIGGCAGPVMIGCYIENYFY